MTRSVTLVCGPPCAGKSTHVARHAQPGDLIICFDQLARQAGSPNRHRHTRDQRAAAGAAFRRHCEHLADRDGTAWVIRCAPTPAEREQLAQQIRADHVVVLIPPIDLALRRAAADRRQPGTFAAIRRWFATYTPSPVDTVTEAGMWLHAADP